MPDKIPNPRSILLRVEAFDTDIRMPEDMAIDMLADTVSIQRKILSSLPKRLLLVSERREALAAHKIIEDIVEEISGRM
jgi:hypothetical protein